MRDSVPTMLVILDGNKVVINESDFDPSVHSLIQEKDKTLDKMNVKELREFAAVNNVDLNGAKSKNEILSLLKPADASTNLIIPNENGKFIVVDAEGKQVGEQEFDTIQEAEASL